jgi:2-dehydro-3-deoxy-phosphogluconate aldolase
MNLFDFGIGSKVLLNIQADRLDSSLAAKELMGASVLVGVMARDYPRLEDGAAYIEQLHNHGVLVSAGLGDGSADQWHNALQLALRTKPAHLNQIFPAAALSAYALRAQGIGTIVNAMIRPTGTPGRVVIGTGPLSQAAEAVVSAEAAMAMMKEMGVESVKFYPIEGTKRLEELRAVARAAAAKGMMLEPTGGITPDNVAEIVSVCLEAGVKHVMPHLYGSLKNPETKELDLGKLEMAYHRVRQLFGEA